MVGDNHRGNHTATRRRQDVLSIDLPPLVAARRTAQVMIAVIDLLTAVPVGVFDVFAPLPGVIGGVLSMLVILCAAIVLSTLVILSAMLTLRLPIILTLLVILALPMVLVLAVILPILAVLLGLRRGKAGSAGQEAERECRREKAFHAVSLSLHAGSRPGNPGLARVVSILPVVYQPRGRA